MKKLLTILLSASALVVNADDTADLLEVLEVNKTIKVLEVNKTINEQKEVIDTVNQYISQRLFQLELKPKFMASRLAFPNTYLWYIWNDYDKAKGFNKLEIAEDINNLTK